MSQNKKHDDVDKNIALMPSSINKAQTLLEIRNLHKAKINVFSCYKTLVNTILLLNRRENFSESESGEIFFCITKLFQNNDPNIRRLVYHIFTALENDPNKNFMAISCLIKDLTGMQSPRMFQANAIKALVYVIDDSTLNDVSRHLKQSIVSNDAFLQSSALLAALCLHRRPKSGPIVRKWAAEASEALSSPSPPTQAHAFALLSALAADGPNDALRLLDRVAAQPNASELLAAAALFALRRFLAARGAAELRRAKALSGFLRAGLGSACGFVRYEALRTLCGVFGEIPLVLREGVLSAVRYLLNGFLTAEKYVCLKLLEENCGKLGFLVNDLKPEISRLMSSANPLLSSLAMNFLLNTADEEEFDQLLKSVETFLLTLTGNSKINLLQSVTKASQKFPAKQPRVLALLWDQLKQPSPSSPRALLFALDALSSALSALPPAAAPNLDRLAELIEDCDSSAARLKVLFLFQLHGPAALRPSRLVLRIFNRFTLEPPRVRCAAVDALCAFGRRLPALRPRVSALLAQAAADENEAVRERAAVDLRELRSLENGENGGGENGGGGGSGEFGAFGGFGPAGVDRGDLEWSLAEYLGKEGMWGEEFVVAKKRTAAECGAEGGESESVGGGAGGEDLAADESEGEVQKESEFCFLTEKEFEYAVECQKRVFARRVALLFRIKNSVAGNTIFDIGVCVNGGGRVVVLKSAEIASLSFNEEKCLSVLLDRAQDIISDSFECKLTFKTTPPNASSAPLSDSVSLESVCFDVTDFLSPPALDDLSFDLFKSRWAELENCKADTDFSFRGEKSDLLKYSAILAKVTGLKVLKKSVRDEVSSLVLSANALTLGGGCLDVLCRALIMGEGEERVRIKASLRCENEIFRNEIINRIEILKQCKAKT